MTDDLHPGHGDMAPEYEALERRYSESGWTVPMRSQSVVLTGGLSPEQEWKRHSAAAPGAIKRGIAEACDTAYQTGVRRGFRLGMVVALVWFGLIWLVRWCLT